MRTMQILGLGLAVALTITAAPLLQAQDEMHTPTPPPEDAHMDARVGTWQVSGTMMGMPYTESLTRNWTLGHRFFSAEGSATMTMPDGTEMSWQSVMTWKVNGDGTYTGIYMDSTGMMGPFTSHIDEDGNLVTDWTDEAGGTVHRAVDTATPEGGFTTQFSSQQEDGTWVESGLSTAVRVEE